MYKIYDGLLPEVINVLYIRNKDKIIIHSYNTWCRNILRVPKGPMIFLRISTRLWSVLLLSIDMNVSLTTFKHNFKTCLLQNTAELKYPRSQVCHLVVSKSIINIAI